MKFIGRAENLLCISDRCAIEEKICAGKYYTRKQREEQRLVIYEWLEENNYIKYMTEKERFLFEKKVENPLIKKITHPKSFEHEAIEPLLWTIGLVKRLSSYDKFVLADYHSTLKTDVADTNDELLKIVSLRSEDEVILRDQIAMLWHWRAIEGKNTMFKKEPIKDVLLKIFGDAYKDAVNTILRRQKKKQDFMVGDKYVYELNTKELRHLYMRTLLQLVKDLFIIFHHFSSFCLVSHALSHGE